jgi:hypothetical protein
MDLTLNFWFHGRDFGLEFMCNEKERLWVKRRDELKMMMKKN